MTVEIVAGEFGIQRGALLEAAYLGILTAIPVFVLWKLNAAVETRFRREQAPFFPLSDKLKVKSSDGLENR